MERIRRHDATLLILGILATFVGWLFIFDAGYARSISSNLGVLPKEFVSQFRYTFASLLVYVLFSFANPGVIKKWASGLWFLTLVLLFAVTKIGHEQNGAKRWIGFGELNIQPSEFAKLTLVLFFATVFAARGALKDKPHWTDRLDRWMPAIVAAIGVYLIEDGKDLGTAAVVGAIAFLMAFLGGVKPGSIALVVALVFGSVGFLVVKQPYRLDRIVNHSTRWDKENVDDNGYQTTRAEVGIATGSIFGVGLGNGWVKHKIPAPTTDFIMATVAEETGLVGTLAVISIIAGLVLRLLWLARNTFDRFGKLVLTGIAVWIGVQTCVNLMMANATLPAIGIPVPFVSSGGSSLVALWLAIGIAQSVVAPPIKKEARRASGFKWWWHRRSRLSRA
jgi:cell division protein FtsW